MQSAPDESNAATAVRRRHIGPHQARFEAVRRRSGFGLESWDRGRLVVNRSFADVLRNAGLMTFDSLWSYAGGCVAKNVLRERTTTRIVLPAESHRGEAVLYLKRHAPPPWREYMKPLVRLRRPIVGARNEWEAILHFHEVGLRTMTPVAFGQSGRRSLLLTEAIIGCRKLSELIADGDLGAAGARLGPYLPRVAAAARTMHAAGLHHQDFYLTHLLVPEMDDGRTLFVIDLGRVRRCRRLARRWIVKDLAQLHYSAIGLDEPLWRRFLELYLSRSLGSADTRFAERIERKAQAIARHSRKNRL